MSLLQRLFFILVFTLPSLAGAQVRTQYVNLVREDFAPLFNCRIYTDYRDEAQCQRLTRYNYISFDNGGYAVNCYQFRGSQMDACLDLARIAVRVPESISCSRVYGPRELDECEATRRAYRRGEFSDRDYYRPPVTTSVTTSTTSSTTVIDDRPVSSRVVVTNTCGPEVYDRAYNQWRIRNEELKKRARSRATTGAIIAIGGIILGGSDNDVARGSGQVMMIGGATLIALGLVDLNNANMSLPHLDSSCRSSYVTEVRRVEIERRYCTTTKYTESGRYSSRSYYEVNCESERYVTFEEFQGWNRGVPVRY